MEVNLHLKDTEWPCEYIDHDREIARAVVYDDEGYLYFMRVSRDDEFGKASVIETSGGGVECGEQPAQAIIRELSEEMGAEAEIVCELGTVSDFYCLIHRHNINHYYLCKVHSFGETNRTEAEKEQFHLSLLKLTYEEALQEYENNRTSKFGRLVAQRELPVLEAAKEHIVRKTV